MVSLVVLRAEGLQAKPFGHELTWHGEVIGNQLGSGHLCNLQPTPIFAGLKILDATTVLARLADQRGVAHK